MDVIGLEETFLFFERERKRECELGRGAEGERERERERGRILSRLQAERGAQRGARSYDPGIMTRA